MAIASGRDFRRAARRRLPPFLFHYIDGAAYDETTCRENVEALQRIRLRQRVLRDVSEINLSTTLFGREQGLPVVLGPVGLSGMYARRGEAQAARAAAAKGVPMCLSTVSVCPLQEVAAASPAPLWFQLYVMRDRGFMLDLLAQAKAAGCSALVFTVDMPMPGARYRDTRSGMSGRHARLRRMVQAMTHPRWAWDVGLRGAPHQLGNITPVLGERTGLEDFIGWMAANFDPSVTWGDLAFIRDHWDGPLIIKGVLDVEDAREVAALGADGVVVSNHGGRQLDGVLPTAEALPRIVEATGDALTVLVDGGVRSGLDVVKMMALGARGVLLGRAWAYALGAAGGKGVTRLLEIIEAEMRIALSLTGSTDVTRLTGRLLADPARD
jgi:L-lactate dehydrogenase (cytochrome)